MDNIYENESVEVAKTSTQLQNELWSKLQDANIKCQNEIESGCSWNNKNVWLSMENQHNFKATFDLCRDGLKEFPIKLLLGEEYHTFTKLSTLQDFYVSTINHVEKTLQIGRASCRERVYVLV